MPKTENLDAYENAYTPSFKFTDENNGMLDAYARRICARLESRAGLRVLSLGIGHKIVTTRFIEALGDRLQEYVIVEGSDAMIKQFTQTVTLPTNVQIVRSWFEEYTPTESFDVIEMGFVLEHVDDPDLVVSRFKTFLRPGGSMFLAVPNARSLHRLIGHEAGFLDDVYRLSEYDLQLGHKRYFDYESFTQLALRNGLKLVASEGLFLKPLTTSQLETLALPAEVWAALYNGGRRYPTISNAILLEATV